MTCCLIVTVFNKISSELWIISALTRLSDIALPVWLKIFTDAKYREYWLNLTSCTVSPLCESLIWGKQIWVQGIFRRKNFSSKVFSSTLAFVSFPVVFDSVVLLIVLHRSWSSSLRGSVSHWRSRRHCSGSSWMSWGRSWRPNSMRPLRRYDALTL